MPTAEQIKDTDIPQLSFKTERRTINATGKFTTPFSDDGWARYLEKYKYSPFKSSTETEINPEEIPLETRVANLEK